MMFEMVDIEERSDSSMSPSLDSPLPTSDLRRKKYSKSRCFVPIIVLLISIGSFTIKVRANTIYPDQVSVSYLEYMTEDYPVYNEEEALENIYYSKVAFCTEHAIKSWSCGDMCQMAPIMGKEKIRYISEGERFKVQGYVAQIPTERFTSGNESSPEGALRIEHDTTNDTKCMVSFRGSLNGSNWYANFLAMLRPWPLNDLSDADWCPGCKAHYGFARAYDELRDDVHTAIKELNCTRLVLSGHSLGAAIATIATFDLRSAMGYKVDATWTFGKPRIGNAEFVNSFEAAATEQRVFPPMWRVVHYHDPVPRAPPKFFEMHPVAHGGLEIYYTNRASSEYIACPQHGAIENQSDACMGGWPLYLPLNMDHVTYLNESFAFKNFPDECKATE